MVSKEVSSPLTHGGQVGFVGGDARIDSDYNVRGV
jgi:hypothetical protein